MKRLAIILLSLTMLLGTTVYADGDKFTLNDVYDKIENCNTLKLMDYQLKGLDFAYNDAKDAANALPVDARRQAEGILSQTVIPPAVVNVNVLGVPITLNHTLSHSEITQMLANFGFPFTNSDLLAINKVQSIIPKTIISNKEILEKNKELALQSLKLGAKQLFNGILLQDKVINLYEEISDVSSRNYNDIKAKYENGLVSENDYNTAKYQSEQDAINLRKQKRTRQNMIYSLNKMLGIPIGTDTQLEGEITQTGEPTLTLEDATAQALSNRVELFTLNEDINLKEEELKFTNIYYKPDDIEYLSIYCNIEKDKEQLEKDQENIKNELQGAYETITLNSNNIQKAKIALENATTTYNDLKKKCDAGLITQDTLAGSHIAVTSAQLSLTSAINSYNTSIDKLYAAAGIGPEFKEVSNEETN